MNEEYKLSLAPMVNMEPIHLSKLESQPEHNILPYYVTSGGAGQAYAVVEVAEKLPSDYVAVELRTQHNEAEQKSFKKTESKKKNTDGASSTDYIMCQNGKAIAVHMRKGVPVVYAVSSDTDFPVVNCEYCDSTFRNKKCYAWHLRKHHPEMVPKKENKQVVKSAICSVCNKRFQSNALLKYHYRKHTNEKPIKCPMCEKCFRTPLNFKVHLRTHTGERPYSCPRCPKEFMTKAAINRHERVHTGEKPYECPTCGQRFTQSNSVKLHVNTVHLKLPAPYKRKSKAQLAMQKQMALAQHLRLPE